MPDARTHEGSEYTENGSRQYGFPTYDDGLFAEGKVGGLLIDATTANADVLLQVGIPGARRVSHAWNPTTLSDIFIRVGGYIAGTATTSLEVDSDDVILDNLWLWRADHGAGTGWTSNVAAHGLVVNGDNVLASGLAVEHYQQNQVVWNGNGGETIFFQEAPYDVPSQDAWMNGSARGFSPYSGLSGREDSQGLWPGHLLQLHIGASHCG